MKSDIMCFVYWIVSLSRNKSLVHNILLIYKKFKFGLYVFSVDDPWGLINRTALEDPTDVGSESEDSACG